MVLDRGDGPEVEATVEGDARTAPNDLCHGARVGADPVLDTLSVLFTDLVGSTELRARLGEDGADVVRRAHDELIADVVAGHGGRVVKGLGDGFLATFGSAARATNAAVAIQQAFDRAPVTGADVRLSIRIGLSAGDVSLEDDDVFGTPVIEAARLCAAAEGNQILASAVVVALGGGRGGHTVTPHGDLELKGLPEPVPTVEIGWERSQTGDGRIPLPAPLAIREGTFPFCGRDDVIEGVTTTWKHVRHTAAPACILVAGEPGVGKTRLAAEFARAAHDDGVLVLFGRCDEDLGIAFQPFVEALRHHVAHLSPDRVAALGAGAGDLARLDPQIPRRFPSVTPVPTTGDPSVDQYRLFEAIGQWLAAAGTHGLVLVLDDVHWATKPTLLALRHLLTAATAAPLLVIATYRDTDLDRTHPLAELLADLRRVDGVERVALRGLDRAGVEQLMATTAEHALDAEGQALAAAVHAETEGNSFFVVEILRHLAESGSLVFDGERWVASGPVAQLAIPDGVREVVGRRLSRLSDDANEVLSWSAVIGREVRLDVLSQVAGGELRGLDALDEAVDARLVDEVGPGRWRFAHALVGSTLLAELRTTRRARMHLEVGEALEAVAPDDVAALAQHFAEAAPLGAGDKAVTYLVAAGFAALDALDFGQAADQFDRAVEIIDDLDLDVPAERADALFGVAMARRWTGADYAAAAEAALDAAAAMGDGMRMARALLETSRGYAARTFTVDEAAVARVERCLALLPDDARRERALLLCQLIMEQMFVDDRPRLMTLAAETEHLVDTLGGLDGDPQLVAYWLGMSANLQLFPDNDPADLTVLSARIERQAEQAVGAVRNASLLTLVAMPMHAGERARARRALDGLVAARSSLGPFQRATLDGGLSGYAARYGSLDDAARHADDVLEAMAGSGEADAQLFWVNLMTCIRRQQGRHDEALAIMAPLIGEEYAGFLPPTARVAAGGLVLVNLCEDERHDEALPIADEFFDAARQYPRDSVWLPVIGSIALAAVELGAACRPWLREQLSVPLQAWSCWGNLGTIAPVATLRGRLDASLGDLDDAERHFADAVDHCREQRATWFLAEALLYQGQARAEAGAPHTQVETPVREALALSEAGGYATLERRARVTLEGVGAHATSDAGGDSPGAGVGPP